MSHTDPGVDFADIHFDVTSATALQGGGYARVWYTGSGTTTQLYGQVFDPSLNLYKGTFTVSVADGQLDTEPEIYALSDGGFFVSWSSNEVLYGARYDVRGEAEVAPFQISDSGSHPSIAELEGGDIAVVWETRPDIRPSTDIVGAILDADGNRLETISNITEETESWQREASIAPLDGGGFVVTWETDGDPDSITNIDYDVEFRIFDENGTPTTGALTVAAHSGSNQMDPDVATLNNGDFVIVWGAESSNSTVEKIYGRIFDSSGAASSTQFVIDGPQDTSSDQVLPSVAALNDGGFYVSWGSHTHNLYGQRFDENGATVGDYTTIASVSSEQHYNSDVSVSGDGRVFISWQYYSSDNSSFGMNVEILTLPVDINTLEGTEAADTLIGSSGVDRIDGAGGNDNLKGLGANDVIYGGDGADYITGGDGNDLVATGAGDDTVFAGGDGNDTIRGDSGNDTLGGGNGSDLIIGGGTSSYFDSDTSTEDGSDVLYGGTGADILIGGNWLDADGDDYMDLQELLEPTGSDPNTLWGGDGDDFMFGALGNDTFGGGSGDDVMMGLDGDDVIYGGRGDSAISNDTMDGGAGQDQLFAGDGNDSVDGGSDNDVLYGGAGNDFVGGGSGNDSLWGGSGNDVLNSGAGADDIFGGSGADKFVFSSGHGQDIIRDFSLDDDSLDLRSTDTDFSSAADVKTAADQATVDDESGVLIDTGDGNSIFIVGLSINDLASVNLTF